MRYLVYDKGVKLFEIRESVVDKRNPFFVQQVTILAKQDVDGEIIEALKKQVKGE